MSNATIWAEIVVFHYVKNGKQEFSILNSFCYFSMHYCACACAWPVHALCLYCAFKMGICYNFSEDNVKTNFYYLAPSGACKVPKHFFSIFTIAKRWPSLLCPSNGWCLWRLQLSKSPKIKNNILENFPFWHLSQILKKSNVTRTDIKNGSIPQGRYWFW